MSSGGSQSTEKRSALQSAITVFFAKKSRLSAADDQHQLLDNNAAAEVTEPNPSLSIEDSSSASTKSTYEDPVTDDIAYASSPEYDDVALFDRSKLSDKERMLLVKKHFRPDSKFTFPVREHKGKKLKFNFSWLNDFPWLVYSKSSNGGFCLPCVLFAQKPDGRGCQFGVLVQKPFSEFRKALGKDGVLPNHAASQFHKVSVAILADRKYVEDNPGSRVDIQLETQRQSQYNRNKAALASIIECVIYLGRQGLALRGHRDDATADPETNKGNLQELIKFRAKTDEDLRSFTESCPQNATYLSKTTQNDILEILGDVIREAITANISSEQCPFFSIIADELTDDTANKHILSLCIRFLKYEGGDVSSIQEGVLDFTYTERGTAKHLVNVIRTKLIECGLDPSNVRGQSYDTTSAMSSDINGVQGIFRRDVPRALYTPCNSHKLNLVIASASKLPQIRNCVTAVNDAYLFFNASHKRQGFFEKVIDIVQSRDDVHHSKQRKLKGLCKTRWVERFEAFDNFIELAPAVITTCDTIVNPHLYQEDPEIRALIEERWNWDGDTKTKAQGILGNFGQFETIVSLIVLKNVLAPLREITVKLQQRDLDIRTAYTLLSSVKEDVNRLRLEIDDRFDGWYKDIKKVAEQLGTEEKMRRAKVSIYRATQPADDLKTYFKRAVAIPFVDDVQVQLSERFSESSVAGVSGLMSLIPSVIATTTIQDLPAVIEQLHSYEPDISSLGSLKSEVEIWRARWHNSDNPPDNLITALKSCSKDLFPNLHLLLQIACIIPVTSCEAERSFSTVRRIKTRLRSTLGEERLSALVLVNMNRKFQLCVQDIVGRFIRKKPRRLFSALYS